MGKSNQKRVKRSHERTDGFPTGSAWKHGKGIEHAIELAARLGRKAVLVIAHASGDEGFEYQARVRDYEFCARRLELPSDCDRAA